MKNLKSFKILSEQVGNDEELQFGNVNIHIEGNGQIKKYSIQLIKKILKNLQGERHLYVDGEEINPYQ